MKYVLQFQRKDADEERPEDCGQDEEIIAEGEPFHIPMPGDSVQVRFGGKSEFHKVLTRHFSYIMGLCLINIIITPIDPNEIKARIKG